jgi:hypothetical protein
MEALLRAQMAALEVVTGAETEQVPPQLVTRAAAAAATVL